MNLIYGLKVFVQLLICIAEVRARFAVSNYAQLILDVYQFYGTSSVLIIHNDEIESFIGIGPIFKTLSWLSKRGIPTMSANFTRFSRVQSHYIKRIKRPLYVIFLRSYATMNEFQILMKDADTSGAIWLVIFREIRKERILNEYCMNPPGNLFNVVFNTKMIVKCYDDKILREWYSIYKNKTEVIHLATWNNIHGLKLLAPKATYSRRIQVGGITLRVVSIHGSPLVQDGNGNLTGLFGEVVMELSRSLNFKIQYVKKENEYGSWNETTKSWSGIMQHLYTKNADFGVADMIMSTRRLDSVDFTMPLITSRVILCIREPNITGQQNLGYFKTFSNKIWVIIVTFLMVSPIILTVIKISVEKSDNFMNLLSESYLNIWGIYCLQGLPEFPKATPLRLAYFSSFIAALIISAVYSACLISYLTVPSTILPFTTLTGFVKDGNYKLIVLSNSIHYDMFQESKNQLFKNMNKLMKNKSELPSNIIEAIFQVCDSKTAFYTTESTISSHIIPPYCKLACFQAGESYCLAFAVSKGSPYLGIINYHLKKYFDNGMISRLKNKEIEGQEDNSQTEYNVVTLSGVAPVLIIIIVGVTLSIILLIAERTAAQSN